MIVTEVIGLKGVNLVRCELPPADGKPVFADLEWPGEGNLVLTSSAAGIVASGAVLANGLRPTARFPGKGVPTTSVGISYRPTNPAETDPAKMASMTVLSFTDDAPAANQQSNQQAAK